MKKILFITVIMATLALSGCLRHCEGFPPQMQQTYFPYTRDECIDGWSLQYWFWS